jgi:hypothetical protein
LINNKKDNSGDEPVVSNKPKEVEKLNNNTAINQPKDGILPGNTPAIDNNSNNPKAAESVKNDQTNLIAKKQNDIKPGVNKEQIVPVKNNDPVVVQNKQKEPSNDLKNPEHNTNVTGDEGHKEAIVDANPPSKEILTDPNKKTDIGAVTAVQFETSDPIEQSGKSNKGIRGFLRKVTRTFEKRTNIKATDDDDRLLVAGLAIKL